MAAGFSRLFRTNRKLQVNREIMRKDAKSQRHDEQVVLTNFAPFRVISRLEFFA
jgi:hypothetical protein